MPEPLTVVPGPVKVMVPVLPSKVPLLFQLPPMLCEKLPPLKVVDAPMESFPFTVILEAAVEVTEMPVPNLLVKLPTIFKAVAGKVFTTAPTELLSVRLPYNWLDMV